MVYLIHTHKKKLNKRMFIINFLIMLLSCYKIFIFLTIRGWCYVRNISGLKVALNIQKQITAKREQVDLLQSRVQIMEETTEKLTQVQLFTSSSSDDLENLGHYG